MYGRIALVVMVAGCGVSAKEQRRIDDAKTQHQDQVAAINQRYDAECAKIDAEAARYMEIYRQASIVHPGGLPAAMAANALATSCGNLEGTARDGCFDQVSRGFVDDLERRYPNADFGAIMAAKLADNESMERMAIETHNAGFASSKKAKQIERDRSSWHDDCESMRTHELVAAREVKDKKIYDAGEDRRRTAAMLQAFADGISRDDQGPPTSSSRIDTKVTTARSEDGRQCFNNTGCGYDEVCVKKSYSTTGVCAKSVNRYGIKTNDKSGSTKACRFNTDCAPGLQCDLQTGVCS